MLACTRSLALLFRLRDYALASWEPKLEQEKKKKEKKNTSFQRVDNAEWILHQHLVRLFFFLAEKKSACARCVGVVCVCVCVRVCVCVCVCVRVCLYNHETPDPYP